MSAQQITIEETTTAALSASVRLGCGNFWEETYQESGAQKTGTTAGLWVLRSDTRAADHVRVHPGQRLDVPGFKLHVLEVRSGMGPAHGAIKLEVQAAS